MAISDKFDALVPTSMGELIELSDRVSKSTIIPARYQSKPNDCLVAICLGLELGVKPMQALQGIAVINNIPCIFGTLARALVMATGQLQSLFETEPAEVDRTGKARCEIMRKGYAEPFVGEFTLENARKAGLMGKDNYQKYPGTMLTWRAFHMAARKAFPDVYKGMAVVEELQEIQPGVWARPQDAQSITLSLDPPLKPGQVFTDEPGQILEREAGGPPPSSDAQARAFAQNLRTVNEANKPKRGRPPKSPTEVTLGRYQDSVVTEKPQEPQATTTQPTANKEETPPASAATGVGDLRPPVISTCAFCGQPGHGFNDCPQNKASDWSPEADRMYTTIDEGATANGSRTLNDEEIAEVERKLKLFRPRNQLSWLLMVMKPFGVEDLSDLPADKLPALIKRMEELA